MNEAELDALLRDRLAPPPGPPERIFLARVDRAVAEAERYRLSRARVIRQLTTEALALAAVAASLAFVVQVPQAKSALAQAPGLVWPALLSLLLLWMLVRDRGDALA